MSLAADQSGTGIPLVFLHAFPMDRRMWAPQASFSRHYRMITIDLPGFGESRLSGSSMDAMARSVMKTLDALNVRDKCVFVGLSMGGYVLLHFARIFPDRLRAAVFVSTRSAADSPEGKEKRFQNIQTVEKQGVQVLIERQLPALLGETTHKERLDVVENVRTIGESQKAAALAAGLRGMAERLDTSTVLDGLQCPGLFISGAEDGIIKSAEMELISRRVKNSEFHVVEKAGHLLNLERPDVFEELLSHFLKRRVL